MTSWIWLAAGLVLLILEVITPGVFVLLFFGLGALITGFLVLLGVLEPLWAQLLSFSVVSGGSLVVLRSRLMAMTTAHAPPSDSLADLVGGVVVMVDEVLPGGLGRAEHRGAPWTVHNEGGEALHPGDRATVRGVDGLTLRVLPERGNL